MVSSSNIFPYSYLGPLLRFPSRPAETFVRFGFTRTPWLPIATPVFGSAAAFLGLRFLRFCPAPPLSSLLEIERAVRDVLFSDTTRRLAAQFILPGEKTVKRVQRDAYMSEGHTVRSILVIVLNFGVWRVYLLTPVVVLPVLFLSEPPRSGPFRPCFSLFGVWAGRIFRPCFFVVRRVGREDGRHSRRKAPSRAAPYRPELCVPRACFTAA